MKIVLSSCPSRSRTSSSRPIWASVWVRKPAKTSCRRACMRRSSAASVVPGLAPTAGRSVEHGAGGHHARSPAGGRRPPRATRPSPGRTGPGRARPTRGRRGGARAWRREAKYRKNGLPGAACCWSLHHADGLVGQVLAQVVAVLGPARRLDVVVVVDQIGGPLVGLALQEAVVALEARGQRPAGRTGPAAERSPRGAQVPLADGQGGVAGVAQHPGQRGGRLGDAARCSRGRPAGSRPGSPCRRRGGCAR